MLIVIKKVVKNKKITNLAREIHIEIIYEDSERKNRVLVKNYDL